FETVTPFQRCPHFSIFFPRRTSAPRSPTEPTMRLSYVLVGVASILTAHHDTVAASAGNDVALSAVMSLGFLHLVGADESIGDQSRLLRGNKITDDDNEERGFAEVVERMMAKNLIDKLLRTHSFSALEKTNDGAVLDKALGMADDTMKSVFKFADDAKMRPEDLAKIANNFDNFDDALKGAALKEYTKYWNAIHKVD
ncbi:hypothetical protein L916_14892, partial [Phytophthora nicotianae]